MMLQINTYFMIDSKEFQKQIFTNRSIKNQVSRSDSWRYEKLIVTVT